MHRETPMPGLVPGMVYLDPGVGAGKDKGAFVPDALPLERKAARSWLSQTLEFGSQFVKRPGDIAAMKAAEAEAAHRETSHEIRSRILDGGAVSRGQEQAPDPAMASQMTLLLAHNAEGELLKAKGMGQGVKGAWQRFRGSLGLDDEEEGGVPRIPLNARLNDMETGLEEAVPWRPVFKAFLTLVPDDAILFVDRPDMVGQWLEAGIPVEYPPRDEWGRFHPEWPDTLPGVIGVCRESGERLLLSGGGSGQKALAAERQVIIWMPEMKKE
jgi:hypothetical protein